MSPDYHASPIMQKKELRLDIALALVAVLGVNLVLYFLLGFRQGGDAPRYLGGADRLLAGDGLSFREQAYFGYILVVALVKAAGLPVTTIYVIHVAAACAAGFAAIRLGRAYGGEFAGVVAGLSWALFYEIQKWNFYLVTDGLFTSAVMIACWLVIRASRSDVARLVAALAGVMAMASLRFNGVLFATICLVFLFIRADPRSRRLVAAAFVVLAILPSSADISPFHWWRAPGEGIAREGTLGFMTQGQVIWETVRIPMPAAGGSSGHTLVDLFAYVFSHPLAVARLFLYRSLHYLFAYNPHFSTPHILASIVQWLAIYVFASIGLVVSYRRAGLAVAWLPVIWLSQAALVVLTVGDYDGRYSLYGAPALLPFVAVGVHATWLVISARLAARRAAAEPA